MSGTTTDRRPRLATKPSSQPQPRSWYARSAAVVRWLHIYVSLLGFTALVFFGVTGITLNHPTWFGIESAKTSEYAGTLDMKWLHLSLPTTTASASEDPTAISSANSSESGEPAEPDWSATVAKFEVAEFLRAAHELRGAVGEFRVDEFECLIVFKGPGYSADVVVDRDSGKYTATETVLGAVAVMNDLHKGRDSGPVWSLVIDVSAILTVLASVTGIVLLLFLKRRRTSGLIVTVVGTIALGLLYVMYVP